MSFKVEALPGEAQKKLVQDQEGKLGSGNFLEEEFRWK